MLVKYKARKVYIKKKGNIEIINKDKEINILKQKKI